MLGRIRIVDLVIVLLVVALGVSYFADPSPSQKTRDTHVYGEGEFANLRAGAARIIKTLDTTDADGRDAALVGLRASKTEPARQFLFGQQRHGGHPSDMRAKIAFALGQLAEADVRWPEAYVHYKQAVELDPLYDHLVAATEFSWRNDEDEECLVHVAKAIELAKLREGAESLEMAFLHNHKGICHAGLGQDEQAASAYQSAIDMRNAKGRGDTKQAATDHSNLARALRRLGRYDDAEPIARKALNLHLKHRKPDDPKLAGGYESLARVLLAKGDPAAAEPLLRKAVEIEVAVYGRDHPRKFGKLQALGSALERQGKWDEGREYYVWARDVVVKTYGSSHPRAERAEAALRRYDARRARKSGN